MSEKPFLPTPDALIKAKKQPDLVEVPERLVLALDGAGGPGEPAFSLAVGALYGISYTERQSTATSTLTDDGTNNWDFKCGHLS